ncbi:MAG: acyl-CoA thioesterase [Parachlamydiaceae bacterium]
MIKPPFSHSFFISFHLADPGGILFFGHAFSLTHQAFELFVVHALEYSWNDWFEHPDWIVPIRHTEADYVHPIKAGRDCAIEVAVTSLSNSSFTLRSTLHQSTLCCTVKTVHLFLDRKTGKKIDIPSHLRDKLLGYLYPHLTDRDGDLGSRPKL